MLNACIVQTKRGEPDYDLKSFSYHQNVGNQKSQYKRKIFIYCYLWL